MDFTITELPGNSADDEDGTGLIERIELLEKDSESSKYSICVVSDFRSKNIISVKSELMLEKEFIPVGPGLQADTKVAGIFESEKFDGKRNKTPGVKKLSSGVALRCGPGDFRLPLRIEYLSI